MALITREAKGSKLSFKEMDGNLTYLEELAQQGGTGITSSFQIGFSEFIIENGLITQENDIWTYEGVLTVGKGQSPQFPSDKYLYGYRHTDAVNFGSIDPLMPIQEIYWVEALETLYISPIETIGKVIIDEGEETELILQPSDFTVDSGGGGDEDFEPEEEPLIGLNLAIIGGITSGVISNPFPVVGGTHTIKIQYIGTELRQSPIMD